MKEDFFRFIAPFYALNPKQKEAFEDVLVLKKIPSKTILIQQGRVADSLYFILKGGFRSYLLKDGKDITDYFFFEKTFASDYASLYSGIPSRFYLEAIEESEVLQLRRVDLLRMGQKDLFFETFGRVMAEMAFVEMEERTRLFHHGDLEARFSWMMDKFPEVFLRVPQYHIASYLGVNPESLSRMKKKLGSK